jgi:hypothetical protein
MARMPDGSVVGSFAQVVTERDWRLGGYLGGQPGSAPSLLDLWRVRALPLEPTER